MQNYVTCGICGISLKMISRSHLKKHNITVDQYKLDYPEHPIYSEMSLYNKKQAATLSNSKRKGIALSEETKQKISNSKKQQQLVAWNKGIPLSDDVKSNLSRIKKQQYKDGTITHWNLGNITPDDVKQRISETSLSQHRSYSEDSKAKRSASMDVKYTNGWVHPSHRPEVILKRIETSNDLHWYHSNSMVSSRLDKFDIPRQYDFSCSYPEKELRQLLDTWNIKYVGNDRTIIKPKELDIFIPSHNIAIEYCGLLWHSEVFKGKNYHREKMERCKHQGIRLITIFEDEWIHSKDIVIGKIKSILNVDDREVIYARKCHVREISSIVATTFMDTNHIQKSGSGSVHVGLYYIDELVAVAIYRNDGGRNYLLNRFATSKRVIGGFSKIERFFDKTYLPSSVSTFADLRWSVGTLYELSGYTPVNTLLPDYSYIDPSKRIRIHKFNFRRKNLAKRLEYYDPSLSESVNCNNNGWYRIYNCGLLKYTR